MCERLGKIEYALRHRTPPKAVQGHRTPRRFARFGGVREENPDADALMCQAGVSPVSYQSGTVSNCRLRRACNKVLWATVHLWANSSRLTCPWAQACYQHKRTQGQSHASALRCLGKRCLKILWRLCQNHETYDEAPYLKQLQRREALTWSKLHAHQTA